MRKVAALLLMLFSILFLTGCWNNRPISNLAIVTGIGIDRTPGGKIELTIQVISFSKSGSNSSASQSGNSTVNISAEGKTLFDAVRNLTGSIGQKPYYAQSRILVLGETTAKEGLSDIWDFWERDHETNKTSEIIVVKNGTAKEVLAAGDDIGQISAENLADMETETALGKNVSMRLYQVTPLLSQPLAGLVIGTISPRGATLLSKMKMEGAAVFKHGRMSGYLSSSQTRGYLFAAGQLGSTILMVANPKEKGKLVSIEVISSSGTLTADLREGSPRLGIRVEARGNLAEEQGSANLATEKEIKILTREAESLIRRNIRSMLKRTQKEYDCDILDFSDLLYKYHYNGFQKIKSNWDALYKNAKIKIDVRFDLERPGLIKKPAFNP